MKKVLIVIATFILLLGMVFPLGVDVVAQEETGGEVGTEPEMEGPTEDQDEPADAQVDIAEVDETEAPATLPSSSTYQPRSALGLDDSLADTAFNEYSSVSEITLVRVDPPSSVVAKKPLDWIHGVYYYAVTKLLFTDMPFNFVVTWQGDVYEGKFGGRDVQPPVVSGQLSGEDGAIVEDGRVLIAYFSDGEDASVSDLTRQKMQDLVLELINQNAVEPTKIKAVTWDIADQGEKTQQRRLELSYLDSGDWYDLVDEIVDVVEDEYDPVSIEYKGEVVSVEYDEEVEAGSSLEVTVKAKNTGDWVWYPTGGRAIYVATPDARDEESLYYMDEWASFTRVGSFEQDRALKDEEVTFKFKMKAPMAPGDHGESFMLVSLNDQWLTGTDFDVRFKVTAGDEPMVEVLPTNVGFLNVRKEPGLSAEILTSVDPGEYYVLLEEQGNWYKIRVSEEIEGWAYAQYLKKVE